MKKTKFIILGLIFIVSSWQTLAHGEDTFAEAEELIKQKIACNELTEDQLEIIGDYYMEQMHPEELHELMDERMGGEGSESLRQVHIVMAKNFYCGEHQVMPTTTMNTMMGRTGMMNTGYGAGYGMMGGGLSMSFVWLIWITLAAFVFGIVFWWTYQLMNKRTRKK